MPLLFERKAVYFKYQLEKITNKSIELFIQHLMLAEIEKYKKAELSSDIFWFKAASTTAFPENGGACVKYKDLQIAVFNFTRRGEWYACQNLCPHKMQMILSRGMIGSCENEPKVACPFHKKTFSLRDGKNLNGDDCTITTYPVKVEDGFVFVGFDSHY